MNHVTSWLTLALLGTSVGCTPFVIEHRSRVPSRSPIAGADIQLAAPPPAPPPSYGPAPSSYRRGDAAEAESRRLLPASHLMRGLVKPRFDGLARVLANWPRTGADWDSVEMNAGLLHEASYLLERGYPAGQEEGWEAATSRMLRQGSTRVLTASRVRNHDEAIAGFQGMRKACSTCHRDCPAGLEEPWPSR